MAKSPDSAAAMPNSCCCQSIMASPVPGSGVIRCRSHAAVPRTEALELGWLRPVREANGRKGVRFRPS